VLSPAPKSKWQQHAENRVKRIGFCWEKNGKVISLKFGDLPPSFEGHIGGKNYLQEVQLDDLD